MWSPEGLFPLTLALQVHLRIWAQDPTALAQDGGHQGRRPVAVGVRELREPRPIVVSWGTGQRAHLAEKELSENIISFN